MRGSTVLWWTPDGKSMMYNSMTGSLRWARVFVLVLLVTAITAVVAPAPARAAEFATAPGASRVALTPSPIGNRTTTVYRPQTARANAPLVIMLHGKGGTGVSLRNPITMMDTIADREGFVVAYPEADKKEWSSGPICCRGANLRPVDDVAFLNALTDQLVAEEQVDPERVYAVGLSAGGVMAYKWACEQGGRLAGISPVVGALLNPCAAPTAMTVVAVHGSKDKKFPVAGGTTDKGDRIPPLDEALAPFRAAAACNTGATTSETIGRLDVTRWEQCANGLGVVRSISVGEGHVWPGFRKTNPAPLPTYPHNGVDTSDHIWTNLERYAPAG